ncbi:DNA-directed RNA polymerases I, II, and III subunit RPABC1 [Hondaea fermentalgiana]|uniref:DNA-directed RNA polymerases I, II, and III subunit RPABC1 n=1 Tax=Hondaea fermentalgiana TaxID=2315210 RepID=A0A2R5G0F3_9STRA|nr:DNA-directed RNA polymerases I, II, and III subunit RPABC1 [Hondaea fermentalgiana]|eukprot:GBG24507.1 DNA-directed RNA polymerases I, II, and III subunit RPABC1 [Hondaea fermentalgiana]
MEAPSDTDVYRVVKTLASLMRRRGFDSSSWENLDLPGFHRRYCSQKMVQLSLLGQERFENPTSKEVIMFCFPSEVKVGVKPIREFNEKLLAGQASRGILVLREGISPFGRQALQVSKGTCPLEYFTYAELKFDLMTHEMVPHHTVLSDAEKVALLQRYKIKAEQLPRMRHNDAVSRYFGLRKGQVVRIVRKSDTAGSYVTYRIVTGG